MAHKHKRTLMDSERIRQVMADRRTALRGMPLTYTERHAGNLVEFKPSELDTLHVDSSYQRLKLTPWVNELIHVLMAGGTVPDPIAVVRRPDKRLFIVDGQQRYWAHVETQRPLKAMIYDVKTFDEEQKLFLIFNRKKAVTTDDIVRSWPGKAGDLLRATAVDHTHPMGGRIPMMGRNPNLPFQPGILLKGLCLVTTGKIGMSGGIQTWLERTEQALKHPDALARAEALLRLFGELIEPSTDSKDRLRVLAAVALGKEAYTRWAEGPITLPTPKDYRNLRLINWDAIAPTSGMKWLPMIEVELKRRWHA